jgi:type IV pilus assembly protein PilX
MLKQSKSTLRAAQRGIALMMAMIALVAMSLAAMALLRSVDTGNTIAGNVAFRQAASQAADVGLEAAFANITATLALPADLGANKPSACTTACTYYATTQALGSSAAEIATDIPAIINWTTVPAVVTTGLSIDGVYTIKYVVERLCSITGVTDENLSDVCFVTEIPKECRDASHDSAGVSVCQEKQGTYFRASFYVTGPRNTKSYSQASFVRYVSYL